MWKSVAVTPLPTHTEHDPGPPTTVVLVGATGDLSKRKLLPGLFRLLTVGLLPHVRIVGTSLDDFTQESFVAFARESLEKFDDSITEDQWEDFARRLYWAPGGTAESLNATIVEAERGLDGPQQRLHYLSVPPRGALAVIRTLAEAGLVENTRVVMEKPFGLDLASARQLNETVHEVFDESQVFRIDHFLGKEAALNILAFRFANGSVRADLASQHDRPRADRCARGSSVSSSEPSSTRRPAPIATWS